ncbi:hypothetical protein COPG_00099 [Colwellia phage 9A]|uniref:DUF4326 domain-containing protein n=1 Tax=Colwellia phage 9A TaxID=765765 RepID=I3UMI0_9CAUD|nr:hypothetical protein COPG_00099 [Colwellia phage 9A]AFK66695.1 hypothetical protein COPG_00099 [Colwellia phage 9A]
MSKIPNGVVMVGRVGYNPRGFEAVRCDRNSNSPLKNPFGGKNGSTDTRENSLQAFKEHFPTEMSNVSSKVRLTLKRLLRKLKSGISINLQCHCQPNPCHCDNYKEFLDKELAK